MTNSIRGRCIKIGNSQGFRIPKVLLEESGIDGEVEIEAKPGEIIIRSVNEPRSGWEEAFATMAENQDDQLVDEMEQITNAWDLEEWEW